MAKPIVDFLNSVKILEKNYTTIDISFGFYVGDLIPKLMEMGHREKALIITSSHEAERQAKHIIEANPKIHHKSLIGDIIDSRNNVYSDVDIQCYDIVYVFSANAITRNQLDIIADLFYAVPIILIGDSKSYCVDVDMHRIINASLYFINETSKIPDLNLDIVYLNKRIRTTNINKLEPCSTKSYDIEVTNLENIGYEDMLSAQRCVVYHKSPREINNEIRCLFGYGKIPVENEPVISEETIVVHKDDVIIRHGDQSTIFKHDKIYIPKYTEMKVSHASVGDSVAGILRVTLQYHNDIDDYIVEFTVNMDTYYYNEVINESEFIDYIPNSTGIKLEYAYVYSPLAMNFKTTDEVLAIFSSIDGASTTRDALYQLTSFPRKRLVIKTDHPYYLY